MVSKFFRALNAFFLYSRSIELWTFYIIDSLLEFPIIRAYILHQNNIHRLFIDISPYEFVESQNFSDHCVWIFFEILIKITNFLQIKHSLIFSYGLNNKFVIESSKHKLSTFATITISFLFDKTDVLVDIEWLKDIAIFNAWNHLSKNLDCISCNFIL